MITVFEHHQGFLWIADDTHPAWVPSFLKDSTIFCYVPDLETFEKIKYTAKVAADYSQIKDISGRYFVRLSQLKEELKNKIIEKEKNDFDWHCPPIDISTKPENLIEKINDINSKIAEHLSLCFNNLEMINRCFDLKIKNDEKEFLIIRE